MSRIAKKQTISPKLYRHFAVATLIITAMLGFFADGENRDATAEALAAQMKAPPRSEASIRTTQAKAFREANRPRIWNNTSSGGGGDEGGGDGGSVEFSPGARRPQNVQPPVPMSPAMQLAGMGNLPDVPPPGMPAAVFARLKREQKRLKNAGPQVGNASTMASMIDQSNDGSIPEPGER